MASYKSLIAGAVLLLALLCTLLPPGSPTTSAASASWSSPVDISQDKDYETGPSILAEPNGSVTIAWEKRVLSNPTANYIMAATSAPGGNGPFAQVQLSHSQPQKSSGSVRARVDSLGRRHFIWWQYEGSSVCDYYARMEADGRTSIVEKVPGTCGQGMKNTALAIGPDNSVHALFGHNLQNIAYWERTDAGWVVQGERIPGTSQPEHLNIAVAKGGTIMIAWKDAAPKGFTDIYLATRRGPGNWGVQDMTAPLSPGCPYTSRTYFPVLQPDYQGGMRLIWTDEHCTPRNPPPEAPFGDLYYQEWTPQSGWLGHPFAVEGGSNADSLQDGMAVDRAGVAHIIWVDQKDFQIYYSEGRGTNFSRPVELFPGWARNKLAKDMDITYAQGYIYLAFTSDRDDPEKDIYLSRLPVQEPPAPTPTPPPPPPTPTAQPVQIPGSGNQTFPETGKTITGLFLDYWDANGSLSQQGYPISNLMLETSSLNGKPYTVQYTERAVFEYHPENQAPFNVLLSQLGTIRYRQKYPNGAPGQVPNTSPGSVLVPETGKRLGSKFLAYWQTHGGLMQQGYPISDEFTEVSDTNGRPYLVQYFERAVFEYHSENQPPYDVLLSLLGNFQYKQKYQR